MNLIAATSPPSASRSRATRREAGCFGNPPTGRLNTPEVEGFAASRRLRISAALRKGWLAGSQRVMAVARRAPRPSYGLTCQRGVAIRIDSRRKLGCDARKRPREQRPRRSVKNRWAGGAASGPTETLEGGAERAGNGGLRVTSRRDPHTTSVATLGRRRKASKGETRSTSAA